jgi:hypothetical protein
VTKPNIRIITAQEIREENELFLKAMAEEAAKGTKALSAYECQMKGCIVPVSELAREPYDPHWREKIRQEMQQYLEPGDGREETTPVHERNQA